MRCFHKRSSGSCQYCMAGTPSAGPWREWRAGHTTHDQRYMNKQRACRFLQQPPPAPPRGHVAISRSRPARTRHRRALQRGYQVEARQQWGARHGRVPQHHVVHAVLVHLAAAVQLVLADAVKGTLRLPGDLRGGGGGAGERRRVRNGWRTCWQRRRRPTNLCSPIV